MLKKKNTKRVQRRILFHIIYGVVTTECSAKAVCLVSWEPLNIVENVFFDCFDQCGNKFLFANINEKNSYSSITCQILSLIYLSD